MMASMEDRVSRMRRVGDPNGSDSQLEIKGSRPALEDGFEKLEGKMPDVTNAVTSLECHSRWS